MNKSIFLIALLLCLTWSACDDDQATFPDEAEFMDFAIGKYLVPANDGLWLIPGDNGELLETDTIYIGGHGSLMTSSFWFVDEHTLLIGAVIWGGRLWGMTPICFGKVILTNAGNRYVCSCAATTTTIRQPVSSRPTASNLSARRKGLCIGLRSYRMAVG